MGGGGYLRNLLEQFHIFRMLAKFEVADQCAIRCTAEDAVFFFVDFLEECALVELGSALHVAQQVLFVDVQDANLEVGTGVRIEDHVAETAPGAFELLEIGVMENFVELNRQQVIDLRDALIDHRFDVASHIHMAFEELTDKFLDEVLASFASRGVGTETALLDNAVEQIQFFRLCGCCLIYFFLLSHVRYLHLVLAKFGLDLVEVFGA